MRFRYVLLTIFVIIAGTSSAQEESFRLIRQVDLMASRIAPFGNVIKLYDTAVDEVRSRAFVSGTQTEFVAMIDLRRGAEIGTVTLPFAGSIHNLDCNPFNGYLLVSNNSTPAKLYAIDPLDSRVKGTFTFSQSRSGMACDHRNGRIYVAEGNTVRILDGSTLGLLDSFSANVTVGGMAIDSLSSQLFAVSRNLSAGKVVVQSFGLSAPYSRQKRYEISSDVAMGNLCLDAQRDRLLLVTHDRFKELRASTGVLLRTVMLPNEAKGEVYDRQRQVLYMTDEDGYSSQGESGSWSKIYSFDFAVNKLDSMRMGDKTASLAIDNRLGILVVPSMHSGWLELLHLQTGHIDSVDTGESADEMALSPDRRTLYIAKRLGGSSIMAYGGRSGSVDEFPAGNWPAVVETDSSLNRLYSLNVFESSISVIDASSHQVVNTIRLSIPEARTDAIPVMHHDAVTKKLYLAFPEFNTILVVDLMTEREIKAFRLQGFNFDPDIHAAIGVIQLTTAPAHNRMYALQRREKKLKVYDMTSYNLLDSLNVTALWSNKGTFEGYCLGYDAYSDRLYLGNRFLNPVTLAENGAFAGHLFVGYAPNRAKFYSIEEEGGWVSLLTIDTATLQTRAHQQLFQPSGDAAPVFAHDPYADEFYISEFNYAVLRHYDLDPSTITKVAAGANEQPLRFTLAQNYPNPFNSRTVIRYSLVAATTLNVRIYDSIGREVAVLMDGQQPAGEYSLAWDCSAVPSGSYFYRLSTPTSVKTRAMQVLK
jgi:DNA-binding beta-propeller fold protein YncE